LDDAEFFAFALYVSLLDLYISLKEIYKSLNELYKWKREICISFTHLYKSPTEIYISLKAVCISVSPTTKPNADSSHEKAREHRVRGLLTLGNKDSNHESPDPETGALPFGHSPIRLTIITNARSVAKAPTGIEPVWTVLQTVA